MVQKTKRCPPRIRRLARPLRGLITPKFVSEDQGINWCTCKRRYWRRASRRVKQLAVPLQRKRSCKFECPQFALSRSQIIQPYGRKISTRLDQLAIPYVRSLVSTKMECKPYVLPKRIGIINQHIQRSLHTVYSRLANVAMPVRKQRSKWTEEDWKRHRQWLSKRAGPKKCFSEPKLVRPSKRIDVNYMDYLAQPKNPVKPYAGPPAKISDPIFPISKAVLNFVMTPTYIRLATPFKPRDTPAEPEMYESPFELSRDLAKITSVGIKTLAEPRRKNKRFAKGDNASEVFVVSANAKKAKPSERTKKLSEPRKNSSEGPKENPFAVSKAALKPLKKDKLEYYVKLSTPKNKK